MKNSISFLIMGWLCLSVLASPPATAQNYMAPTGLNAKSGAQQALATNAGTASLTLGGALNLGALNSNNIALNINQSSLATGTVTGPGGGPFCYNCITITDQTNMTGDSPLFRVAGTLTNFLTGGSNSFGTKIGNLTIANHNTISATNADTIAASSIVSSSVNDNGIGEYYGYLAACEITAAIVNGCNGLEIDVAVPVGTVPLRNGLRIANEGEGHGTGVVNGVTQDSGLTMTSTLATGLFRNGWLLSGHQYGFFPIDAGGNLITSDTTATIANAFDFSLLTITSNIINSQNAVLTGAGTLTLKASGDQVQITSAAGTPRNIDFQTAGANRFLIVGADNAPESGANAGSNFRIQRYSDAGAFIDIPLLINRASGEVSLADNLTVGAQIIAPSMTQSAAAQTGTVCWAVSGLTYDATLGCLASDERLKKITAAAADPLAEVRQLKPITYRWNNGTPKAKDDPGEHIGLGAFATAYVDERLVARDAEGNPRGWRQDAMVALLVGAIQQQQTQIDALTKALAPKP